MSPISNAGIWSSISSFKRFIRPCVPVGLLHLVARQQHLSEQRTERERRLQFNGLRSTVVSTIGAVHGLTSEQCVDVSFLEREFIPSIGLNNEYLHEQPPELSRYLGQGLHIWQYPNQLAPYLAWLAKNATDIESYMEIGCRWGGMFILVAEWLRKNGANLRSVIAIDPIEPTPFIDEYFKLLRDERGTTRPRIEPTYIQDLSTSPEVRCIVDRIKPDLVFIDGDHSLRGALADHMLVHDYAKIIVHHDVCSQACPDTTLLWNILKKLEGEKFEMSEFVGQDQSVMGNFLGIGVMKRTGRHM